MDARQALIDQEQVERTNLHTLAVERWMAHDHGFSKGIPMCAGRLVGRVKDDDAEAVTSELAELIEEVFRSVLPVSDQSVFNELLRLAVADVDWKWIVRPAVQKAWEERFGNALRVNVKTKEEDVAHG